MYKVLDTKGYENIMDKHHISSLTAKVMICRNISFTNKIVEKKEYDYKDMDKVVGLILKSINEGKKIAVYGDYDVDGICAVSILYRTFKILNYDIGYYVPNRYKEGYGLSIDIVRQMKQKGYSVLICVDNGIKAFEAIDEAKKLNMQVIVLDHHQKGEHLPNCDLLLHPEYSGFSDYNMCGASICYYLSKALLAKEDEICLALAGIATIGDVMPLVDQNKIIVSKALKYLNTKKYKAINVLNSDKKEFDENLLSMSIIPKLNSIGRICKSNIINKVVNFLTTNNESEISNFAKFIEETNEQRKKMTEENFNKLDDNKHNGKIIIKNSDDMLEGINGIIATRFVNKYNLPSIVFSLDETKKFYKGSARSVDDFNIVELFEKSNYIEAFGGHKGAAGLTIKKEFYDDLKKEIEDICKDNKYEPTILEVIEVERKELSYNAYKDLLKVSPFGEGNSKPLFLLRNIRSNEFKKSKDGRHILLNISDDVSLVGFNMAENLGIDNEYDLVFKLELNNMYSNKITCICVSMEGK